MRLKGSILPLCSSDLNQLSALDFFIQGSLQESYFKMLFILKNVKLSRENWLWNGQRLETVCMIWELHVCCCGSYLQPQLWVQLQLVWECECVLTYTVCRVSTCGLIPTGLIFGVRHIAHNWSSSSGSQSKVLRSHNHFHWIYKVQLKLGGIQIHEWCKRGSYRSCLNWSENCRSQVGKGCSLASCRHRRGKESRDWQAYRNIALFPFLLLAAVVVFPHSTI